MNKNFLYKKVYPLGFIDGSEEEDLATWFLDDSRDVLEKKFRECNLEELIIELIEIFRNGNPSYVQLAILFGFENTEEKNQNNITKTSFYKIQRTDIAKIEMDIEKISNDKPLMLRNLYLYFTNLPSVESIKSKLNKLYSDIFYKENEGLMICEKECNIIIREVMEVL